MRSLQGTSDLSLSHLGSVWWKENVFLHVQIFSPRRPSPPSPFISLDSFLPSAICLESFKWFFLWNCSLLSLIWIPILSNPIQSNLSRLFLQRETEGRRGRGGEREREWGGDRGKRVSLEDNDYSMAFLVESLFHAFQFLSLSLFLFSSFSVIFPTL